MVNPMPPTQAAGSAQLIHVSASATSAAEAIATRDRKIAEAVASGIPRAAVARSAGLDPETVKRIVKRQTQS